MAAMCLAWKLELGKCCLHSALLPHRQKFATFRTMSSQPSYPSQCCAMKLQSSSNKRTEEEQICIHVSMIHHSVRLATVMSLDSKHDSHPKLCV